MSFVNPNTWHLICNNFNLNFIFGTVCLCVCVCAFSLRRESPDMMLGDKPLISEVVLSHQHIKDPPSLSDASPPNPFPARPLPYKRHCASHHPPPHSFPYVLPTKTIARHHSFLPPNRFHYPTALWHWWWAPHRTASLYLTEMSRLATVAYNGYVLSFGEPCCRQWTPSPWWTDGLAHLQGPQSPWAWSTTFSIDDDILCQ
jgi:hypothetical protein